jgi:Subtilase family/RTX calcium-binding nonapeptide repeat (4 copies)
VAFVAVALFVLAAAASALARDFENPASPITSQQFGPASVQRQDTPTDDDYDIAEADDEDVVGSTNLYDERFDLFGFPSLLTSGSALYGPGNPHAGQPQVSGFNAAGAWKVERGRSDTSVAILDTGIKWDHENLRLQVRLNKGELPLPEHADSTTCAAYDCDGNGVFNVADYASDPRVSHTAGPHGSAQIDAEDLIATFSGSFSGGGVAGGIDDDGNGFVDDIAGWDFFDNDNDPWDASSYFAAANHGSGRAENAAERGNDGDGGLGTCPKCQLVPIRTWDTFVSDGNTFAMGILYATDNGVSVIEGANGSTYHSAFAEAASRYAYDHGVVQTFSGDDLNTGNHNYPANYSHAMLIQGTVPDTLGLGNDAGQQIAQGLAGICGPTHICAGTALTPTSYFRGANTTQYGGKSSISMEGSTGSENTGKAAGAAALVISAAKDSSPAVTLRPDETREILEQTAERVTTGSTGTVGVPDPAADPSAPSIDQWTSHFGWGRVDLGAAVSLARSGKVPPEAAIDSPDWYSPQTGASIHVTGLARARFASGGQFNWKLEWGVGEAPTSWTTSASGTSSGTVTDFGNIDLNAVRTAIASAPPSAPDLGGPTFSALSPNPYAGEFTARLVVNGQAVPTPGVDRRVFTEAADPTLRPGYPRRMGTGGEAPIRYADLNGDNVQELVVPTEDGVIHAYEPDGIELPGWPVHTQLEKQANGHDGAPGFAALASTPPSEPLRGPVVADLDDDGRPEVIDSAGIHVYAWEPDGSLRPGFPVASNLSFCGAANESQPNVHPKCGFLASPAVGRLKGQSQPLDIVIPSLDGHLYAFDGNGNALPGFPKQLIDSSEATPMTAESINEPAIGDLNGDGTDDIVVATNETYGAAPPSPGDIPGGFGGGLSAILANAAGGSSRVYAVNGANGSFLSGWPIKLNGAIQSTLPLIGPGQNPALVKIGGAQRIVVSTTGSATIGVYKPDGSLAIGIQQGAYGAASDATDRTGTINLFESASIGKLLQAGDPDVVKYGLTVGDVANLALSGQNVPYNHLIGAYDPNTGTPLPAFPRITDDFQFLSSSDIAQVDPASPANQVVAGTGLGLLHAYDGLTGKDAPGFPKVTGGWLFAPAAFSEDHRMADITREGYLFQWNVPDIQPCQSEWPSFRHDQQQSGNYDRDGTPPYKPTGLSLSASQLSFVAPGDDNACGTVARYEIRTSDSPITPQNFAAADPLAAPSALQGAGSTQTAALPTHMRYVAIRAVDEAGNVGWPALLDTAAPSTDSGSGGGSGTGGGGNGGNGTQAQKLGPCSNVKRGSATANHLRGTRLGDLLRGLAGNDRINGGKGKDCLYGNQGDDRIKGGFGRDRIFGGRGDDAIFAASQGHDRINCGPGQDLAVIHKGDRVRGCEAIRRR